MKSAINFIKVTIILSLIYTSSFAGIDSFEKCNVSGSVALYDLAQDDWYLTDEHDSENRTGPGCTFNIMNLLISLESGVIKEDEVFKWDGVKRWLPVWNQDTNIRDSFSNSTVWVYNEMANRGQKSTYSKYMNLAKYGDGEVSYGVGNNFWGSNGKFAVSPKEQINMLVGLYRENLPFSKKTMSIVKGIMQDKNDPYIYGKTGWTSRDGQEIGWWIGYKEEDRGKPIFFATRIRKNSGEELGDFAECRKSITYEALRRYESGLLRN